ncbi:DUF3307 domain-containing protein [Flaviaesturariibacter terrae]
MNFIPLLQLLLAHLLTDFVLQPKSWVERRGRLHFAAKELYLHGAITALVAGLLTGFQSWTVVLLIFSSHTIIDGVKSYAAPKLLYFLLDQLAHLLVLIGCWLLAWQGSLSLPRWEELFTVRHLVLATAFVFVTKPLGIFIGQFTAKWRERLNTELVSAKQVGDPFATKAVNDDSLATAGSWIGMAERVIILILVLKGQYEAFGLLLAAKSIIRFSDSQRTEAKTEYLLIGTLTSVLLALGTGLLIQKLLHLVH